MEASHQQSDSYRIQRKHKFKIYASAVGRYVRARACVRVCVVARACVSRCCH